MKIVIMPLYGIGDALMSTPALRNIGERLGVKVTYLHMFKSTRDALEGNPYIAENIHFPFLSSGKLAGVKRLLGLRGKFDASINFYPSNRKDYNLASFLVGAPVRIGHRYVLRDFAELNFLKNRTVKEDDSLHNVEENLRLLSFIGIKDPVPFPLEIYLSDGEKNWGLQWLKSRGIHGAPLAGFHPGSSLFKEHAKKRWGKYAGLIREFSARHPEFVFLLFGGKEEYSLKQEIINEAGLDGKVLAVETDTIRQTASIMRNCGLFITNDSGLMHLSAALQVPVVAIFGPTNPAWLAPWKCRHKVIRIGEPCGPCFRYSPLPQRCVKGADFSCMRDIEVAEVLTAAEGLIRT